MTPFTEDVLAEYVLGNLSAEEHSAVEAAEAESAELCEAIREMRELLCAVPAALDEVRPSDALTGRLMASLETTSRFARFARRAAEMLDITLERAGALLARIDDPASWGPGLFPGMALYHVEGGPRVANAIAGFVRLEGGTVFPAHEHVGTEEVLMLQGSGEDDDGTLLGPGDYHSHEGGTSHGFRALEGPPCIYLTTIQGGVRIGDQLYGPDSPEL